jgi:hypothetical protein
VGTTPEELLAVVIGTEVQDEDFLSETRQRSS